MITFLQHTDPLLPHYRAPEFTFPRGALSTLDRKLLGDLGSIPAWLGATITHGICETHVLHHVSSKIPHYNAWEASDALRQKLLRSGIKLDGGAAGWAQFYRVMRQCKVVFFLIAYLCQIAYKLSFSLSRMKALWSFTKMPMVSLPCALSSRMVALTILVLRLTSNNVHV